jgi:hypothetical protein
MKQCEDNSHGIVSAAVGLLLLVTGVSGSLYLLNKYADSIDGPRLVNPATLDCWTLKEPELGVIPAHRADKRANPEQLHLQPEALVCFEIDKDGAEGRRHFIRQWWRTVP